MTLIIYVSPLQAKLTGVVVLAAAGKPGGRPLKKAAQRRRSLRRIENCFSEYGHLRTVRRFSHYG